MCFFKRQFDMPKNPGAIESPKDSRDIMLAEVQPVIELRGLPEAYIIPYRLRIHNQGNNPFCVAETATTIKEEKERREQNALDFDGEWLYNECKKIDKWEGKGTYLRVALSILKNKGAKLLGISATDESMWLNYRIGSYARVGLDIESLKNAIYQNGVVMALYRGSNKGWNNAYIKPTTEKWGHCVSLIGWNKNYLIFQNSWGKRWGEEGLGYIPSNYHCKEAWSVLTDIPTDFKFVNKPKYSFPNNLQMGMKNKEIKNLQRCLKYDGTFPERIDCTGYYFGITAIAVYNFQVKYKVAPLKELDRLQGKVVGPKTREKLNELFL